ncbi:MAG: oligosaccharide flippase family protein [Dermatophilaceae bacterium]
MTSPGAADTADPGSGARPVARSGAALLMGTVLGNVLAYAFLLILTRYLTADGLGAVGSLVNLSTICGVPALGLQLVAARLVTRARHTGESQPRTSGNGAPASIEARVVRLGVEIGLVVAGVLTVASPLLAVLLHLDVVAVVVLAAGLVPMSLTFAAQGILQGEEKFGRLAVVMALNGLMRFLAGAGSVALGVDVIGVLVLLSAGWLVTASVAFLLLHRHQRLPARRFSAGLTRLVAQAVVPTAGLLFLSSIDVLLARHYLSVHESGAYTVGAIFEKAAFWGMAFLATLFYPRMARPDERRRAIHSAAGITLALGVVGVSGAALLGDPLVRLVGGEAYAAMGPLVWRFTALGVVLALIQVLVYAGLASARNWTGVVVWVTAAAIVISVSLRHGSVSEVVTTMLVWGAALAVVAGVVELGLLRPAVSARRRARSGRPPR